MIKGKNVVVVMPAYNAAQTIEKTWREVLDQDIVDLIIVVDDASQDGTVELARHLFVFDNHSADASSINFRRSVRYGSVVWRPPSPSASLHWVSYVRLVFQPHNPRRVGVNSSEPTRL